MPVPADNNDNNDNPPGDNNTPPADQPKTYDQTYVDALLLKVSEATTATNAKNTELETVKAEVTKLTGAAKAREIADLVTAAANTAELASGPATLRMINESEITFGDDGKPNNIDALVAKVKEENPWLHKTPGAQGGQTPPPHVPPMNPGRQQNGAVTAAQLRTMTPAEVAKLPEDQVFAALAADK